MGRNAQAPANGQQAGDGQGSENSATTTTAAAPDLVKGGLQAAEDHLAATDEDVTRLWATSGPKTSRIGQIAGFLHKGSVVVALIYKSGKFKLHNEMQQPIAAKGQSDQIGESGQTES